MTNQRNSEKVGRLGETFWRLEVAGEIEMKKRGSKYYYLIMACARQRKDGRRKEVTKKLPTQMLLEANHNIWKWDDRRGPIEERLTTMAIQLIMNLHFPVVLVINSMETNNSSPSPPLDLHNKWVVDYLSTIGFGALLLNSQRHWILIYIRRSLKMSNERLVECKFFKATNSTNSPLTTIFERFSRHCNGNIRKQNTSS